MHSEGCQSQGRNCSEPIQRKANQEAGVVGPERASGGGMAQGVESRRCLILITFIEFRDGHVWIVSEVKDVAMPAAGTNRSDWSWLNAGMSAVGTADLSARGRSRFGEEAEVLGRIPACVSVTMARSHASGDRHQPLGRHRRVIELRHRDNPATAASPWWDGTI